MSFHDDEIKKIKVDAVMIFVLEPVKGVMCEGEGWREAAFREMKSE